MTMMVEHTSGAELKQDISYPDLTGKVVKWNGVYISQLGEIYHPTTHGDY